MNILFELFDQFYTDTLKCTTDALDTFADVATNEEIDTLNSYVDSCLEQNPNAEYKQRVIEMFAKYNIETGLTNED
jgi:hypothetical protein